MAYGNYLASVADAQVQEYRSGCREVLSPSKVVICSHLIAHSVRRQPLGHLLGEVLDGGAALADRLWHPLRAPTYHRPEEAASLFSRITEAWVALIDRPKAPPDGDWYREEIAHVLDILAYATKRNEGVVSILEPPMDAERACRVSIPIHVIDAAEDGSR